MEITPLDSSVRCRLCLDSNKQLVPIFGEDDHSKRLCGMLEIHLHIKVDGEESLPKHICLECLEMVETFEQFYTDVTKNQWFLVQNMLEGPTEPNDANVEHEDEHSDAKEEVIEEPVDLDDSFMMHCTRDGAMPEISPERANPPSYDEAQQNKRVGFVDEVNVIEIVEPNTVPVEEKDHCYLEKDAEERENSIDAANNELLLAETGGEEGIIVKVVNKFNYPRMIRDGKLVVRGDVLDNCLQQFYGLVCEVCKDTKASLEELFSHYREAHNEEGYVVCCGRKLEKRLLMAMHMAKHLEPEAFECPHCKKMMTSPRILRFHIRNHLPESQRPLKCDICPRRFSYVSGLLMHASTHQNENKSKRIYHICDTCGRAYRTRQRLQEHISSLHPEDGSGHCATCKVCGKQFASKGNLTYHMTTHEPNVHEVKCNVCGKWLKNKICLGKHMVQHTDMRYQCTECDYNTTSKQRMKSHLRVQHTDEKPHVCQVCGKAFKLLCNLRNHQVQHTGERNFKCEFCSRLFASSSNYYSHRKRLHSDEMEVKKRLQELQDSESRSRLNKKNST